MIRATVLIVLLAIAMAAAQDAPKGETCTSNANCTDVQFCKDEKCSLKLKEGDACKSPDECQSNNCMTEGKCAKVCIGASSHVAGRGLREMLHPTMRMQVHPLRLMKGNPPVRMLCFEAAGARLCASARHVVEIEGKMMYMAEFCATRACKISMETPLNFKGACGAHIEFMPGVRVTQHAGVEGMSAVAVSRAECVSRANNRFMWTMRTL